MKIRKYFLILLLVYGFVFSNQPIHASEKKEAITIQLKWFHQFQFAGYYAAIEKGFYAEEGLDVTLRERSPGADYLQDVIEGISQYGVSDSGLLLSRLQGKPVVMLTQIFQHSPLVFLTLKKSGIRTPFDLKGKTVMFQDDASAYASLNALIVKTLGDLDKVMRISETFRNKDLLEGKTDAMVAYITDQPFWFKERGVDVNVIDPRDYGIDFYGDNLFTTEKEIRENPRRVEKMIRATIKGWRYALEHKQEIVDLILKKYNTQQFSRTHLMYEAEETENIIVHQFIAVGSFETTRFQKIAEIYSRLGLTNLVNVDERFFYTKDATQIELTPVEQAWLGKHSKIRVNGDEWPPFAIDKGTAGFEGISVDILKLAAGRVGLEVEIVPGSWADLKEMLKKRELDVGISLVKTPDREKYLSFTDTYISMPNAIYVAKTTTDIQSFGDLAGKKVPIVKGFYLQEILAEQYPDIEQVSVNSPLEGLQKVISGDADAYIGGLAVSQYLIQQNLISRLKIAGYWNQWPVDLRMGIRSDDKVLAGIIQKSLDTITEEQKARIISRYISVSDAPTQKGEVLLTEQEEAWLKKHPVIRVSNEPDYAPFDFVENSEPAGFSIDYLDMVSRRVGLRLEYVQDTWDNLVKMGKEKKIDLLHTVFYTHERATFFRFTEPYKSVVNAIYVRDGVTGVQSLDDLAQKRVILPKGDTIAELLPQLMPEAEFVFLDTYEAILKAISIGQGDATVLDTAVANYLIRKNTLTNIAPAAEADIPSGDRDPRYRLAVRKDWPELQSILQKAMNTITRDEMAGLEARWFGLTKQISERRIALTEKEEAFLKAHPVIRVHNEKDWPPFNYFEYGVPRGLSIDYMNLLAERLGVKVEYVTGPSWNEFLGMIQQKDLDVMLNIVKTEDRQKYLLYTEPYIRNPNVIICSQKHPYETIQELFGKTVAFPKGFFWEEVLTKSFPQIKRLPVENTLASLKAVTFGKADAALGEEAVVKNLINKNMLTGLRVSGEVNIGNPDLVNLRIGVRDDWALLHSALMNAMADITQQEMNQIQKKWLQADTSTPAPETVAPISFARLFLYGITVFLIISLLAIILIKTLKREQIAVSFGSPWFRGLILAGLSVFVLIVAFLGWYNLERDKTQHLQAVDTNLRGILSIFQDRLDLWLAERTAYMKRLGRDPDLVHITKRLLDVKPDKQALLATDALMVARIFFENTDAHIGFSIINPDCVNIGAMQDTRLGTSHLISKQHPELLQRAFQGEVRFVPPIASDARLDGSPPSETSKRPPPMFFIGPIQDAYGRILAVMALRIDPGEDFARATKSFSNLKTGETYAFDRNGHMLSPSRFEEQLRRIGLLTENQGSALNIEIRDPGVNMMKGQRPDIERSRQPLTRMASRAIALRWQMEAAGIRRGLSPIESDKEGYRDYRGVPVFGAWLWNRDLGIGMAAEIDAEEALAQYYHTRLTVFGILGFTLLLSVGAILFVLIIGERTSRALMRARDNLEGKVEERTAELKEQQDLLQAAEERSRLLLNSAGEGIFGVDAEGSCTFANPATLNMLGYGIEELVGQNVHETIHHSHQDGSLYPMQDCPMFKSFTEATAHRVTDEVLWRKDGTHFPVEYSSTPMEQDGRLVGAVVTFGDITERKAAAERFSALLESAPDAMIVSNETGDIVLVNSQTEVVFGYSREELIGKKIDMLVPEEIRDVHPDYRAKFYADPKRLSMGFRGDFYGVAKDGRKIPMDIGLSPIKTDAGLLVVASVRDITERIEAELAIRDSEDRLTLAAEAGGLGMWEWRVNLDCAIVSDYWLQLKGMTREAYSQSVDQWTNGLHPDDKEQATGLLTEHLNGDTEQFEAEYRFKHPERGWYWEYANARVIERDEDGNPLRMVGYHQDISLRKKMEAALAAERERLQGILDVSPVGVAISTEGALQFVNPQMTALFGLKPGDPVTQIYLDIEDRNRIISGLRKNKIVQNHEMQVYGKNREILDIMASYMLTELDGKEAILGWWIDITELKKTDRELREKFDELARFRRLAIGREEKMIELKKEINELLRESGREMIYKIVTERDSA